MLEDNLMFMLIVKVIVCHVWEGLLRNEWAMWAFLYFSAYSMIRVYLSRPVLAHLVERRTVSGSSGVKRKNKDGVNENRSVRNLYLQVFHQMSIAGFAQSLSYSVQEVCFIILPTLHIHFHLQKEIFGGVRAEHVTPSFVVINFHNVFGN